MGRAAYKDHFVVTWRDHMMRARWFFETICTGNAQLKSGKMWEGLFGMGLLTILSEVHDLLCCDIRSLLQSELCASGCLSRETRLYLAQGAVHSSDNEKIVWFLEEVETILLCLDLSCTALGKLRNENLFEGQGCKITLHRASRLF